jgi:uncharacterized protein
VTAVAAPGTAAVPSAAVRLLLPPSETKHRGGRGRALSARTDTGPLADARARMIGSLDELVRSDAQAAARALLLPDGVAAAALAADASVLHSPTTPALRRYCGVVYDGLDYPSLDVREQRIAHRSVLIFSGLFGVLRGDEPVPDYRVPAKAVLPGVGTAAAFWRPVLADVLDEQLGRHLVIDLRSTDYAPMWRPQPARRDQVVAVRVLSPLPRGGHGVISYHSKHAKGRLAAALIRRTAAGHPPTAAADVVAAWQECCGGRDGAGGPHGLDLYTG